MSRSDRNAGFTVLLGIGLLVLGLWILFAPFLGPLEWVVAMLARVGWPLVLIAIGVLLIMRARGAGWSTAGRRFCRSRSDRMIGGVIGGFAHYIGVDATLLRVVYAVATALTALWPGFVIYLVAMVVVPEEPFPAGYTPAPAPNVPGPPPSAPPVPGAAPSAPPVPSEPPAESPSTFEAPPVPPAPPIP